VLHPFARDLSANDLPRLSAGDQLEKDLLTDVGMRGVEAPKTLNEREGFSSSFLSLL
jgi:hypothetical protein